MAIDYDAEQKEIQTKLAEVKNQLDKHNDDSSNTITFLNTIRKYSNIKELNATILNDLIDSIVVYDAEVKGMKKNRVQKVEIIYKFIGLMQMESKIA